jgi:dTDP-4-dehydrorhamnose reductase
MDSLEIHKVGHEVETLLIQLSTDNVFQGSRPLWTEDSVYEPINAYGRSKREAEEVIQVRGAFERRASKSSRVSLSLCTECESVPLLERMQC